MGKSSILMLRRARHPRPSNVTHLLPCLPAGPIASACPGLLDLLQARIFLQSFPNCALGQSLSLPCEVEQNTRQKQSV